MISLTQKAVIWWRNLSRLDKQVLTEDNYKDKISNELSRKEVYNIYKQYH